MTFVVGAERRRSGSATDSALLEISRTALFGKLNPLAYKAVEGATVTCKLRGNEYVELSHWLYQILNAPDSDLHRIVRHYGIDAGVLTRALQASLDRLPSGASSVSDLSERIEYAVERGWVYGSLMFDDTQVRTGYLLVGMLKTPHLKSALLSISKQFDRIKIEDLTDNFASVLAGSPEQGQRASDGHESPDPTSSERLAEFRARLDSWAEAYPLDVFPKPDLKRAAEVLSAAGLSLDGISAHAMRHVITRVKAMFADATRQVEDASRSVGSDVPRGPTEAKDGPVSR